jgi:hypothetical protein
VRVDEIINAPRAVQLPQRSELDIAIDWAWRYMASAQGDVARAYWTKRHDELVKQRGAV